MPSTRLRHCCLEKANDAHCSIQSSDTPPYRQSNAKGVSHPNPVRSSLRKYKLQLLPLQLVTVCEDVKGSEAVGSCCTGLFIHFGTHPLLQFWTSSY
ncbi:hypothetical protein BS78_06G015700 [Paspalum vaginatum]|nr:hypothetical protein BS78_06G015700 [Paspalum vaginatum]